MLYKNALSEKSEVKSEAPVTSIFCMQLKGVISGRGQGLLRFNHFVDAAIYSHVQTNRNNAVDKQLKPEQLNEPITMYNCGQNLRLSNSQLLLAIHPIAMAN